MADNNKDYFFRVISNQVRFGCGYRTVDGKRQYFAWHGHPDRNSDYITTTEISESEFDEINKKYPIEIVANREKQRCSATDMLTIIRSFLRDGVGCCKCAA